ncbi:HLA class II histocompatibility antigen DRB1-1 beta chain-like [Crotalus adamanteus]|uniref:HLA class II histocompatibility antigen DRB1-1 beta chain-like n=1 Tax=Crotalus adamanteus TaxID=8729 RepID=A0AAW1BT14_CROAD
MLLLLAGALARIPGSEGGKETPELGRVLDQLNFCLPFSTLGRRRRSLRKLLPHFPPLPPPPPRGNPAGIDISPPLLQGAPSGSLSRQVSLPDKLVSLLEGRLGTMGPGVPPDPLLLLLLLLLPLLPPAHFLYQTKYECLFLNRTQQVRYVYRDIYDRQEILRFDSARGEYEAVTALGKEDAEAFNRDKHELQYQKTGVDRFCRNNYEVSQSNSVVGRRAKPTVSISPTKLDPTSPNTILLCIMRGFYPVEIEVRWLKNGRPEEEGVAFGEELQNGDWTYQLQVMLETQPQRGDLYTCEGESLLDRRFPIPPPGGAFRQPLAAARFLYQGKTECRFLNGTQRVRFLSREIYDREEYLRFDSARGEFEAVTALGKVDARAWNRDKHKLQYQKAQVDRFCRYNYKVSQRASVVGQRVRGFYPVEIEVRWLKNGRPEEEGVAFGEELQNGDWTYQLHVMLETQPQRGDVYTCQVEHASLEAPITVQWD